MDLSNLSYEELTELEKKIKEEKKVKQNDGKVFYKCELLDDRLYDVMKPRFPVEKYGASSDKYSDISNEAFALPSRIEKSLFALCDLALGNYRESASEKTGQWNNKKIILNGSLVQSNTEEYAKMFNELRDVFMKYAEWYNENLKGESE